MSFEESLIRHASPTLARIKVANLYSFKFESMDACTTTIAYFNSVMNPKGIYIELLKHTDDFYLIYVYRESLLRSELGSEEVRLFLQRFGYGDTTEVEIDLAVLKERMNRGPDFPHEIGVFLGYPLEDVKSFIETSGKNCIVCGEWKAYHDEQSARCTFCKYQHCKEIYIKVYSAGRQFHDMLVGA